MRGASSEVRCVWKLSDDAVMVVEFSVCKLNDENEDTCSTSLFVTITSVNLKLARKRRLPVLPI